MSGARTRTAAERAARCRRMAEEYRSRAKIMFHEDMSDTALLGMARAAEEAALAAEEAGDDWEEEIEF